MLSSARDPSALPMLKLALQCGAEAEHGVANAASTGKLRLEMLSDEVMPLSCGEAVVDTGGLVALLLHSEPELDIEGAPERPLTLMVLGKPPRLLEAECRLLSLLLPPPPLLLKLARTGGLTEPGESEGCCCL